MGSSRASGSDRGPRWVGPVEWLMAYGWVGEKVRLVPLDFDRHFENYLVWLNSPPIMENLLVGDYPLTRGIEQEWFEKRSKDSSGTEIIFAIETIGGTHLGSSGIHGVNHKHGTATTGSFIGDPHEWGKGYGLDAAMVRSRFCFEIMNLRLLRSSYLEGNERSARMQASAGYVEIGRYPKAYWKHGRYRDEILTCLTRERWESLQKPLPEQLV